MGKIFSKGHRGVRILLAEPVVGERSKTVCLTPKGRELSAMSVSTRGMNELKRLQNR